MIALLLDYEEPKVKVSPEPQDIRKEGRSPSEELGMDQEQNLQGDQLQKAIG